PTPASMSIPPAPQPATLASAELTEMVRETVGPRSALQMSLAKRKLTARHVPVKSLPVALYLRCPACGLVHRWKREDAWVAQVPMASTSKSLAQINKSRTCANGGMVGPLGAV